MTTPAEVEAVARAMYAFDALRDGISETEAFYTWKHEEHPHHKELLRSRARAAIAALDAARRKEG